MSVEPGPLPKPLDKWIVLPGEAGTIQLTRTAWSRGGNALGYLVAFALFAGLTVMSLLRADRPIPLEGGGSMPGWTFVVFFGPFAAGVLVALVWHALGREEWRLGENLLEVQRTLLGRSWARRYTDARLQISYRLQVAGPAAHEVWSLWVKSPGRGRSRRLFTGSWGSAEVGALGELVSSCTHWPLELPNGTVAPAAGRREG